MGSWGKDREGEGEKKVKRGKGGDGGEGRRGKGERAFTSSSVHSSTSTPAATTSLTALPARAASRYSTSPGCAADEGPMRIEEADVADPDPDPIEASERVDPAEARRLGLGPLGGEPVAATGSDDVRPAAPRGSGRGATGTAVKRVLGYLRTAGGRLSRRRAFYSNSSSSSNNNHTTTTTTTNDNNNNNNNITTT